MFGRGRTTSAQARRDREWREFVKSLDGTRQLSPTDSERMRALLQSATGEAPRPAGPAEPQDRSAEQAA